MDKSPRCLYHSSLAAFSAADENALFGILCDSYHGDALTTTLERENSGIPDVTGQVKEPTALSGITGEVTLLCCAASPSV